jgi:predicted ester cyclase
VALSHQYMKDRLIYMYNETNKGNVDVFDEVLTPDFISYGGSGSGLDLQGLKPFKDLFLAFLTTFPDLWVRLDDLIADGNKCALRGPMGGTHKGNFMGMAPPTGKKVEWTAMAIFQFNADGMVEGRWQEWDGVSVMQQLGIIPSNGQEHLPAPKPPTNVGRRMTTPQENKALLYSFVDEVWNKGNLQVADEIFHPQATSPSAPQLPAGPAGVKTIAQMFRNAFPDFHITVEDVLVEGDKVVARFTETGTHQKEFLCIAPTGKRVKFSEIGILCIVGGQVVESWYEVDMLGLMQQLGVGGASAQG